MSIDVVLYIFCNHLNISLQASSIAFYNFFYTAQIECRNLIIFTLQILKALFLFFFMCKCMPVWVYRTWVQYPQTSKEGIRSLKAEVTGCCEQLFYWKNSSLGEHLCSWFQIGFCHISVNRSPSLMVSISLYINGKSF